MSIGLLRRICMAAVMAVLAMPFSGLAEPKDKDVFLTKPDKGDALDIALRHIHGAHKAKAKLTDDDLKDKVVKNRVHNKDNGVTHIYMRQRLDGIEVASGDININITKDGCVASMGDKFVRDLRKSINRADPVLIPAEAVQKAAEALELTITDSLETVQDIGGKEQAVVLYHGGISMQNIPVKLMYSKLEDGLLRLAWNLQIQELSKQHWWNLYVDAETGEILAKIDWVKNEWAADSVPSSVYEVFALPLASPDEGSRTCVTNPWSLATNASPYGWNVHKFGTEDFFEEHTNTIGNNVYAQEDTAGNNDFLRGFHPVGGSSASNLVFTNTLVLTDFPTNRETYQAAAIVNLFYWNNLCHDIHYQYGFDEPSGNFQWRNNGKGGLEQDFLIADAQDGSGFNNANMGTGPDGYAPRMQMFIWTQTVPNRDSDFDNIVIVHEYGHGVSTRLTGGPADADGLYGTQSGGMGEGWSDWWGLVFTAKPGETRLTPRGVGQYLVGDPPSPNGLGIRHYPYSTLKSINPMTYGYIAKNPEVHYVGEVWCAIIWEVYWDLVDKYGWSSNLYAGASGTNGNHIALRLIMDGLKLQPTHPTFVDARDAILLADQIDYGGANQDMLWAAFARRGLGFSAYDAGSDNKIAVIEAFDIPDILGITPFPSVTFSGAQGGGSFTPASTNFILSNMDSSSTISWVAGKSTNWFDISVTSGSLGPLASNTITITLNTNANNLAPGNYTAALLVSNTTTHVGQSRAVIIKVLDTLVVEQPHPVRQFSGPFGGPFTPSNGFSYAISNRSAGPVIWSANLWGTASNALFNYSPTGGTLEAGTVTNIIATMTPYCTNLVPSDPSATETIFGDYLVVSNLTSQKRTMQQIHIYIYEPLNIDPPKKGAPTFTDMTFNGPVGGPFTPTQYIFRVTNKGPVPLPWSGDSAYAPALTVFPSGGTLLPEQFTDVAIQLNSNAYNMAAGSYAQGVNFRNLNNMKFQNRQAQLNCGGDFFTELHNIDYTGTNLPDHVIDLEYNTITFVRDDSNNNGYRAYNTPATNYPTDPTGGEEITQFLDPFSVMYTRRITLTNGASVALYDMRTNDLYVGAYGYVAVGEDPGPENVSLSRHFEYYRVSGMYCDLYPSRPGTEPHKISWKQLEDRVTVTYENIPNMSIGIAPYFIRYNNFQIELFTNGNIRITHLACKSRDAITVGLSNGYGAKPPGFFESDLSLYGPPGFGAFFVNPIKKNRSIVEPAAVEPAVDAYTDIGQITNVDFYMDGVYMGSHGTNPPCSVLITNLWQGDYVMTAIAYNSAGQSTTTTPMTVTVIPPELWWTGEANNSWDGETPNFVGDRLVFTNNARVNVDNYPYDPAYSYLTNRTVYTSNIVIRPEGVNVSGLYICNLPNKTFSFSGGDIGGSATLVKDGGGIAVFSNYPGSLSFSGGVSVVWGSTVSFMSSTAGIGTGTRTQYFGTGPISIDEGKFKFFGAVLADGHTNALGNDFIISDNPSNTLFYSKLSGGKNSKIAFSGNFHMQPGAKLRLDAQISTMANLDSNGHEITGTVFLSGTNTFTRVGSYGAYFSFSGNMVDGAEPSTLVLANTAAATREKYVKIRGTGNTYSGGTIIKSTSATNGFGENWVSNAVEVAANSSLGTGNVTVQGGGLLRLTGNNNLSTNATLSIGVDTNQPSTIRTGVVWVASGVTNRVAKLVLGTVTNTSGIFGANSDPAFLPGPGFIQVGAVASNYTLTAQADNPASGSVSPTGGVYDINSSVLITATANPYFNFVSWTGDATGTNNPVSVLMNKDKSVTAVFASALTLSISSPYGTPVPGGTVTNTYGSVLTNSVNSPVTQGATQYVCAGWTMTGNEPQSGTTNRFSMTLTNSATLTWLWTTNIVPLISAGPTNLSFTFTVAGSAPASQTLTVTNAGQLPLHISNSWNVGWMNVQPVETNGIGVGQSVAVTVSILTNNLKAGVSNGTITISSTNAGNAPVLIPVQLTVLPQQFGLPFTETFETNPATMAGIPGAVDGQHGWISDAANNVVTTNKAHNGSQALSLSTGTVSHAFVNSTGTVYISYWAMPYMGATNPAVPANASAVFWVNTNRQIVAYSNSQMLVVDCSVVTGAWNKFDITCDYTAQVWSLSLNTTNVIQNFGFYSGQSAFSGIQLISPIGPMFFDDLNISNAVAGVFGDSDGDGLPDDWENQHYGNITAVDGSTMASNGVNTVLEAYIAGLNPGDSASVFKVIDQKLQPSGRVVTWTATNGRLYSVYFTTNLLTPDLWPMIHETASGAFTDTIYGAENKGFYQIKVRMAP